MASNTTPAYSADGPFEVHDWNGVYKGGIKTLASARTTAKSISKAMGGAATIHRRDGVKVETWRGNDGTGPRHIPPMLANSRRNRNPGTIYMVMDSNGNGISPRQYKTEREARMAAEGTVRTMGSGQDVFSTEVDKFPYKPRTVIASVKRKRTEGGFEWTQKNPNHSSRATAADLSSQWTTVQVRRVGGKVQLKVPVNKLKLKSKRNGALATNSLATAPNAQFAITVSGRRLQIGDDNIAYSQRTALANLRKARADSPSANISLYLVRQGRLSLLTTFPRYSEIDNPFI